MYELFDSVIRFICDYFWWFGFLFVGFCITDAVLPEKKRKLEDWE